jgi:hypothetical protein
VHKFLSLVRKTDTSARKKNNCAPVTDFMQMNEQLSGMLPNAARLIELQKACRQILPDHFATSQVLQLEKNRLSIGASSQGVAAKLRQKLPLLKNRLEEAGWVVDNIRIKVKLRQQTRQTDYPEKKPLSAGTVNELEKLENSLAESGSHPALIKAVHTMINRHKNPGKE